MNESKTDKKQIIAETYRHLLETTPGDKITVKMLIEECGLSRQTFYYHFKDIFGVVEYSLQSVLDEVCRKSIRANDPQTVIRECIKTIESNRHQIKTLEESSRSREFRKYAVKALGGCMFEILENTDSKIEEFSAPELKLRLKFFAHGIVGVVIEAVMDESSFDEEALSAQLYQIYSMEKGII